jgi:hypothetical protein
MCQPDIRKLPTRAPINQQPFWLLASGTYILAATPRLWITRSSCRQRGVRTCRTTYPRSVGLVKAAAIAGTAGRLPSRYIRAAMLLALCVHVALASITAHADAMPAHSEVYGLVGSVPTFTALAGSAHVLSSDTDQAGQEATNVAVCGTRATLAKLDVDKHFLTLYVSSLPCYPARREPLMPWSPASDVAAPLRRLTQAVLQVYLN